MIKIGVTGGIGSGKSMVCRIFSALSVPVFYADDIAKELTEENAEVIHLIKSNFGNSVYNSDGKLNRKKISELVFRNNEKLQVLNQIIHPAVNTAYSNFLNLNKEKPYTIKEAAILIESGAYKNIDKIIVVTAPETERIQRVMKRDNLSEYDVKSRIKNQLPEEKLLEFADFIINNNDGIMLLPQVIDIHYRIINEINK